MWECPKCGREFKNTNQSRYCGTAPQNIEEYIAQQPENVQPYLRQIHDAIKNALPDAVQKISWSMPTYWKKRNLIQFAASKKHIGLYPGPAAVETFADRLQGYNTSKGTIQLPYQAAEALLERSLVTDMPIGAFQAVRQGQVNLSR